jgi:A/G-specific adenine glycosylase
MNNPRSPSCDRTIQVMSQSNRNPQAISRLRHSILAWYDQNRRDLPWRRTRDPYAIWVSEIMLQQTRVAVVVERYKAFLDRFPTVVALAMAGEQEVLALWSGLGYYRRARMLHQAAHLVAQELGGCIPRSSIELRKLPGIGAYTAAAISSIAYGERIAVVDGNVERAVSRLQGWESESHAGEAAVRRKVEEFAGTLVDAQRPGDFNQALMELGATICTPRGPQCLSCPWTTECNTKGEHRTPQRPAMLNKEVACALVLRHSDASIPEILLEQRPASETVMADMWQLPFLRDKTVPESELRVSVRHAIMQVNYRVHVRNVAESDLNGFIHPAAQNHRRRWASPSEAEAMALTGLTRKVLSRVGLLPGVTRARSNEMTLLH